MSSGKSYKWHGSTISILTAYAGSPGIAITGITKADPAVVTAAAHGLVDGDVAQIEEVVGMTEVNGGVYIVNQVSSSSLELVDENSTGFGTYTSGGQLRKGTFSQMCELTAYTSTSGTTPEIDTEDICSTAKETVGGLPDFGTTQLTFKFAPQTAIQQALHAWFLSADEMAVRIQLPNGGGTIVQKGWVQQESYQSANSQIWTASITIRNTGRRYDYVTA